MLYTEVLKIFIATCSERPTFYKTKPLPNAKETSKNA